MLSGLGDRTGSATGEKPFSGEWPLSTTWSFFCYRYLSSLTFVSAWCANIRFTAAVLLGSATQGRVSERRRCDGRGSVDPLIDRWRIQAALEEVWSFSHLQSVYPVVTFLMWILFLTVLSREGAAACNVCSHAACCAARSRAEQWENRSWRLRCLVTCRF